MPSWQGCLSFGVFQEAARNDQRLARLSDSRGYTRQRLFRRARNRQEQRPGGSTIDPFFEHILRQGYHYRPWCAALGRMKGRRDQIGETFHVIDLDDPFHHGPEDALVIDLLKCTHMAMFTLNLTYEQNQRDSVLFC